MAKKRARIVKPGYWWATVDPQGERPPCIWGAYRTDVCADPDEKIVRVYVCEASASPAPRRTSRK